MIESKTSFESSIVSCNCENKISEMETKTVDEIEKQFYECLNCYKKEIDFSNKNVSFSQDREHIKLFKKTTSLNILKLFYKKWTNIKDNLKKISFLVNILPSIILSK